MLKPEVQDALNDQLNFEVYSAHIYWSMAAYFESKNLKGMANWMTVQALEEMTHAKRFYNYIVDRGGRVAMKAIAGPATDWESPLAAFQDAYHHETIVTDRINKLVEMARKINDFTTDNFLQWFVKEQVEEESSVDEISQRLKLAGGEGAGLFMIDQELAARSFVMPPDLTL